MTKLLVGNVIAVLYRRYFMPVDLSVCQFLVHLFRLSPTMCETAFLLVMRLRVYRLAILNSDLDGANSKASCTAPSL